MPYLIQKDKDGSMIQYWNLHEVALTIGRGDEANGKVDDAGLSRKHFVVSQQGAVFKLKDLGSKNGTCVNHKPATEQVLQPNDEIRAGNSQFVFVDGLATMAIKLAKDIDDIGKLPSPPQS